MIANDSIPAASGRFGDDVQLPDSARLEILDFIANELPQWRDFPGRPRVTAETDLTDQLCSHLNSAARHSPGWRRLQFRTEVSDEIGKGRKIDLTIKPCGAAIIIEGRRHTQFDSILPIECKRLPIPKEKDRDEREYLTSRYSTTGGIQRFKDGHHGAAHQMVGMIAYIQAGTIESWHAQVLQWVVELSKETASGWSKSDCPQFLSSQPAGTTQFDSNHQRKKELGAVRIRHLWLCIN